MKRVRVVITLLAAVNTNSAMFAGSLGNREAVQEVALNLVVQIQLKIEMILILKLKMMISVFCKDCREEGRDNASICKEFRGGPRNW